MDTSDTSPLDITAEGSAHAPLYRSVWDRGDYQPPAVLRTPTETPPLVPRSDLKRQLNLSPQDLSKAKRLPPEAASRTDGVPPQRALTIRHIRVMEDIAMPNIKEKAPPRGIVYGVGGFRRGETRHRILAFLHSAPPGTAWTVSEITRALNNQFANGPSHSAVAAQLYHYRDWMPDVEMRKLLVNSRFKSQYRIRQEAPWPPLPEGSRLAPMIERKPPARAGEHKATART